MCTDYLGHFLICMNSPFRNLCEILINIFRSVKQNISLENIVNMDLETDEETILGLGWILGAITEVIYSNNKSTEADIVAQFKNDYNVTFMLSQTHQKYIKVGFFIFLFVCLS